MMIARNDQLVAPTVSNIPMPAQLVIAESDPGVARRVKRILGESVRPRATVHAHGEDIRSLDLKEVNLVICGRIADMTTEALLDCLVQANPDMPVIVLRSPERGNHRHESLISRGACEVLVMDDHLETMLPLLVEKHLATASVRRHCNQVIKDALARIDALQEEHERLRRCLSALRTEAMTDPLTGVLNRRAFYESTRTMLRDSRKKGIPVAVIMADIDRFKRYNDQYGHSTGDNVLRGVAHGLKRACRKNDAVARYGGDEFVAALPGADVRISMAIARAVRDGLADVFRDRLEAYEPTPTLSIGIASGHVRRESEVEHFIDRADAALLYAKRGGRSRIALQTGTELPVYVGGGTVVKATV